MKYNLKNIKDADVKNKTVLLRADLDVPLTSGKISDDFRLITSLGTINYLLKQTRTIFIVGHLGRPEKEDKNLSLEIVAQWYAKEFRVQISELRIGEFNGWKIGEKLILLENLRFFQGEEKNDEDFSKQLASLADVYVDDAFASSHRAHASIVGVTKYLSSFAGLRLEKEVEELAKVLENPKRPLVVIIGGAKIETKLPLVEKMHRFADYVLVGGEIAENDKVLLKVQHEKLTGKRSVLLVADANGNLKDITSKSAENFVQIIQNAKTIVWNGPMGVTEEKESQNGTNILAEGIVQTSADTIVGGGDTLSFLKEKNLLSKFSFVSTGGGAMLEFLSGEKLPGIEVLKD